jgi:membrane protease YdiL (CAAX protease family)
MPDGSDTTSGLPEHSDPQRPFFSPLLDIAPSFLVSLAWALILRKFQHGNVYELLGPFSLVILAFVYGRKPKTALTALRPTWSAALVGLGSGAVMTLATYPCYWLAQAIYPPLEREVSALYRGAQLGFSPTDVLWLCVVVIAEEVLWRGRCYRAFRRHAPVSVAAVSSVAVYSAAQLGAGSWIVAVLALTCGSVWIGLRIYTHGLLAPLLSHLVFTSTVIVFFPVV